MESSVDAYINAQPEQAVGFDAYYKDHFSPVGANSTNILSRIGNFFTGRVNEAKTAYEAYLKNLDNRNEFMAQQSARAWDKMMDDTKYQRMMKDYAAAGLNPYAIINGSGVTASSAPTSAKADYGHSSRNSDKDNGQKGRNFALLLLAAAKIAATLL